MVAWQRRRRRRKWIKSGTLWMAGVFGVLLSLNVYVFFLRGGTSIRDVRKAVQAMRINAHALPESFAETPTTWMVTGTLRAGETLYGILEREGSSPTDIKELLQLIQPHLDFHILREGAAYQVEFDASKRVMSFELHVAPARRYRAARNVDGELELI